VNNRKNFCSAPWSSLCLEQTNQTKICCISKDYITTTDLNSIPTNKKFIEIRQAFVEDLQHSNCDNCWKVEATDAYQPSMRSTYGPDDFYNNVYRTDDFKLELLDVRWSNYCNLSCVYCGSGYSSKWDDLLGNKQKFKIFPDITKDMLKNLKVLMLAGGEPLLIKENHSLLSNLLETNPNCRIQITTNLTKLNTPNYELLKKFSNVTVVVSVEAVREKYEYIRFGANWDEFFSNFKQVTKDFPTVQTNMVFFPLSMTVIDQAIDLLTQFIPEENVFIVHQHGDKLPNFNSVSKYVIKKYTDQLTNFALTRRSQTLRDKILANIESLHSSADITKLDYYDNFDKLTKQNHKLIFKELYGGE